MALHHPAPDPDRLTPASRTLRLHGPGARKGIVALLALVASVALGSTALGSLATVHAADPTQAPGVPAGPPTCAERFPAEGPAGLDLRLGCIVSEVVGLYTAGQVAPPPSLSTYAIFLGVVALGGIVALGVIGHLVARRAGRRLAPALAGAWWICATCRSVNGAGVSLCYACGSGRPDGPMLTTDEHPEISQSFGSRRKRG